MNYRCAVVFGLARLVTDDEERLAALRVITEADPGPWAAAGPVAQGDGRHLGARRSAGRCLGQGPHGPPADELADDGLDVFAEWCPPR